jgi:hypothetical protein
VHVQELVEQDVKTLRAMWPEAPIWHLLRGLGPPRPRRAGHLRHHPVAGA